MKYPIAVTCIVIHVTERALPGFQYYLIGINGYTPVMSYHMDELDGFIQQWSHPHRRVKLSVDVDMMKRFQPLLPLLVGFEEIHLDIYYKARDELSYKAFIQALRGYNVTEIAFASDPFTSVMILDELVEFPALRTLIYFNDALRDQASCEMVIRHLPRFSRLEECRMVLHQTEALHALFMDTIPKCILLGKAHLRCHSDVYGKQLEKRAAYNQCEEVKLILTLLSAIDIPRLRPHGIYLNRELIRCVFHNIRG